MGKVGKSKPRKLLNRKRYELQKIAPSEAIISHGDDTPPPLNILTKKQIEDKKKLQGAMLLATEEFMRIHRDDIIARATEILKQQG